MRLCRFAIVFCPARNKSSRRDMWTRNSYTQFNPHLVISEYITDIRLPIRFDSFLTRAVCIFIMNIKIVLSYVTAKFLGKKYHVQYIRVTVYWVYLIVLWLFYLVCVFYCGCFNVFCNVWVCVWGCFVRCGCFGNMCTCIYCVLCCFFYVYLFLYVTSVRTTAIEWKFNCSK